MPRVIDQALTKALSAGHARLVSLIKLDTGAAIVPRTDAGHAVIDTAPNPDLKYIPSAELLQVGRITLSAALRVNTVSVRFSAVHPDVIGSLLAGATTGWKIHIARAALNDAGAIIGAPIEVFSGTVSAWSVSGTGKTPTATIEAASHWAAYRLKSGRQTNSASQQAHFPGDLGFDHTASAARPIRWGRG